MTNRSADIRASAYTSTMGAERYRPYPAYKDSGVEWLGEIPDHWEVKRLKQVCTFGYGDSLATDSRTDGEVQVYGSNGAVGTHECANALGPCLVIGRKGSFGKVNHSPRAVFAIDTTFFVDRRHTDADLRWLYYMLSDIQLDAATKDSAIPGLHREDAYARRVLLCGLREQRAIAAFLDRETAKIDTLVAKKERLVELLQEKRSALISHAVTKGLDPDAPLKDSGVEWLGEIPAHWNCLSIARVTLSRCDGPFGSNLKSQHYSDNGVRVIRLQNIGAPDFLDSDQVYIEATHARTLGDHSVLKGDLLVAGLGDDVHPVGRACVAPAGLDQAIVKADCFRFRIDQKKALSEFAAYQLSATALAAAGYFVTGSTRLRMNLTTTAAKKIALPPLPEQRTIAAFLDRETAQIDGLVAKVREAIDRLKELRTALISAAVTGKIDVRKVAA